MLTVDSLINKFLAASGSDLYLTVGAQPYMRTGGDKMVTLADVILDDIVIREMLENLLSADALEEFDSTLEYNTALQWNDQTRLRINVFRQRQHTGIVIRLIQTAIPSMQELRLTQPYADLSMEKRGLVLIVGPTGSGKSTSMAAMIEHRNQHGRGHIVTIEDPVEFLHEHKGCIITQRDVGIDTYSYGIALKNVLRQRPDVIVIGEIRDRDTMEHALVFSETGHLCLATLHAGNASQAIERIINFFPEEKHRQIFLSLSLNLRGILSQRLVPNIKGERSLALEVMLVQGLIKNLIYEGKVRDITVAIERSRDQGMITFDQHLLDLLIAREIEETVALAEADNASNLRLQLTQRHMNTRLGGDAKAAAKASEF